MKASFGKFIPKLRLCKLFAASVMSALLFGAAHATPYLIPNLTVNAQQTFYDSNNGVLAPEIDIQPIITSGVTQLVFSFSGGVVTDGSMQLASADGLYSNGTAPYNFYCTNYGTGTYLGVSIGCSTGIAPALMGVFFSSTFVGTGTASADYRSTTSSNQVPSTDNREQTTYSPLLNQPFWIGDGYTGNDPYGQPVSGTQQVFNIPNGALYLLLGIGADINMADNQNSAVGPTEFSGGGTSVPEPATLVLMGLGFAGLVVTRRRPNWHA